MALPSPALVEAEIAKWVASCYADPLRFVRQKSRIL